MESGVACAVKGLGRLARDQQPAIHLVDEEEADLSKRTVLTLGCPVVVIACDSFTLPPGETAITCRLSY